MKHHILLLQFSMNLNNSFNHIICSAALQNMLWIKIKTKNIYLTYKTQGIVLKLDTSKELQFYENKLSRIPAAAHYAKLRLCDILWLCVFLSRFSKYHLVILRLFYQSIAWFQTRNPFYRLLLHFPTPHRVFNKNLNSLRCSSRLLGI